VQRHDRISGGAPGPPKSTPFPDLKVRTNDLRCSFALNGRSYLPLSVVQLDDEVLYTESEAVIQKLEVVGLCSQTRGEAASMPCSANIVYDGHAASPLELAKFLVHHLQAREYIRYRVCLVNQVVDAEIESLDSSSELFIVKLFGSIER